MKKDNILLKIESILSLLKKYEHIHPEHVNSIIFIKKKYENIKTSITNDDDLVEVVEWNKWFAPRIIYDGINNKEILQKVDELNLLFSNENL